MKKVIGGKRYDTDTAKLCGEDSYSNGRDFHHWYEALYRKTTGEFFLYGEGGPASKYARAVGQNSWSGGERLMPLSVEKAQEWAEEHLDGDQYEAIFGEVLDDGSKIAQLLSLPASTVEKLKRRAAKKGLSLSDAADEVLKAAL